MSRRKQQKPRHLDTDEELSGAVGEGGSSEKVKDLADKQTCIGEGRRDELHQQSQQVEQKKEFCKTPETMERVVESKDGKQTDADIGGLVSEGEEQSEGRLEEPLNDVDLKESSMSGMEPLSSHTAEMTDPGETSDVEQEEEFEGEDGENDFIDEDELDEIDKSSGHTTPLPQMPGLAPIPMLPDSNVKIESLENTKVAVAQFAENNIANPQDLAFLQSTLYNLQQQQIFQLQLLQTLHQQLMSGMPPSLAGLPQFAHVPVLPFLGLPGQNLSSSRSSTSATNQPATDTKAPGVSAPPSPNSGSGEGARMTLEPCGVSSLTSEVEANNGKPFNVSTSGLASSVVTAPTPPPSSGKTGSGAAVDRTSYTMDDPFFKHKCRYCHKVFGSDSALQIHLRSHTGERPYKCNICGNRFSTRGNLKVHFQRHRMKYPHIKMNPNQVPETVDQVDRPQPPMLVPNGSKMQEYGPVLTVDKSEVARHASEPENTTITKADSRQVQVTNSMKEEKFVFTSPRIPTDTDTTYSTSPHERETDAGQTHMRPPTPCNVTLPASKPISSAAIPLASSMGLSSPIHTFPNISIAGHHLPVHASIGSSITHLPHFGMEPNFFPRASILPSKMEDPMEQFMEVQKSETSKLEALVKNIETKLTDPNQCAICHRILSCKSALQMHYRTHTGERPFKCKICGRAFTTKGNLKTHMGVHRAKPPIRMMHQCPVCHKQFTNALVLQQHIRMHTGDLPKEIPFLNPEVMMANPTSTINFMPFPGFQFYPHGMAHPPSCGGELDLRKLPPPSPKRKQEDEEDFMRKKSKQESDNASKGESILNSDEEQDTNAESDESCDYEENHMVNGTTMNLQSKGNAELLLKDESTGPSSSRGTPLSKAESESKSPYPASVPTPPNLVAHRDIQAKPMKTEYYSESNSAPGNYIQTTYSTSLMALEERVKAIDNMNYPSARPLEQMENIIRRADPDCPPPLYNSTRNGEINNSSQSPSMPNITQSECHRDERMTPRSTSPTPSDSNASHASFDSGKVSDNENHLTSPHGGLQYKGFGALDLSPNAFEAATGKPNTTCNVCYKTFACRSALDIHYRSHTKERPFKCEVCDRAFSTKGNMKQHMLTHKIRDLPSQAFNSTLNEISSPGSTQVKSESVPPKIGASESAKPKIAAVPSVTSSESEHCGSAVNQSSGGTNQTSPFVRRPNLKHVCQVCQKPFSSASALQIHMRTHTGDKPFKCTVCGKAFTTKGNLKVHMGTHMWNNGPSRRGRRMSVEGIPALPPKEAEYFNAFAHRAPSDVYPFPFPGFLNGFPPKLNEISVIQSLNGNLGHIPSGNLGESVSELLPASFSETPMKRHRSTSESKANANDDSPKGENNNYQTCEPNSELDLSVKKNPPGQTPSPPSISPDPNRETASSSWMYTTCHLCNKVMPSMSALEMHMKSHLSQKSDESSSKPLMT